MLFCYLGNCSETGLLGNMNLFVLVSEGKNNFNSLDSRVPLKYSYQNFSTNNSVTVNKIWYVVPPVLEHQLRKRSWLIKHELWHGFNLVLYRTILGLGEAGVPQLQLHEDSLDAGLGQIHRSCKQF